MLRTAERGELKALVGHCFTGVGHRYGSVDLVCQIGKRRDPLPRFFNVSGRAEHRRAGRAQRTGIFSTEPR